MKQALLVIDAQQELIEGNQDNQAVFEKDRLIDNINLVITKALESDALVVFMRDKDVANGEGKGFEVHQDIHIPEGAVRFEKYATNSFYGTPLLGYLQENGVGHVVIMGCQTQYCVDTAVRAATVNNLDVTLVGDGHSTTDSRTLSAEQIINHHNEALDGHYNVDHFSMVRNSTEDLFTPLHDKYR